MMMSAAKAKKRYDKKVDLIRTIRRMIIIMFSVTLLVFTIAAAVFVITGLVSDIDNIRAEYTETQKNLIQARVENIVRFINLARESGISQDSVLDSIVKIRFGMNSEGYIFINTYDGIPLLMDAQKKINGQSLWNLTDPDGVQVIQEERRAVENPDGGFIYYSWKKPSTNIIAPKVSFIKGISEWEWMVGAGVYLDSVDLEISILQKKAVRSTLLFSLLIFIVLGCILFLIQSVSKRITKNIEDEIKLFSLYFDAAALENGEIDISGIRYEAFAVIAEDLNRMIVEKKKTDAEKYTSEQRLLLQREQSPYGYVEWNLERRIIDWNPTAERIFGFSKEEMLGKGFESLLAPDVERSGNDIFNGLAGAVVGARNNNENITKSGRTLICDWYSRVLKGKDGKDISIISQVDDITERKLMEERLQESLEEKRILLREVHHRVKNNMAIISSLFSLQSMSVEDKTVRKFLQSSEDRVHSMALIHEHLYKSEDFKNIDIRIYIEELLTSLLNIYDYQFSALSVKTDIIQSEFDFNILIALGMIINEIISNSLKHAYRSIEFPELSISLRKGGSNEFVLTITDNGVGLPSDEVIEQSASIGLTLIKGLVQQISGKLEIRRKDGTEYRLTFPERASA